MDKLLFFFTRKDGLTHEQFAEHYLQHHAPLGMRVTITMAGYTVNLVGGGHEVDAVTEIWTDSAPDFFDPSKSFANEDDAKALMADHDSFIGPYDAYQVDETVVHGEPPVGASGETTAGVKQIVRYADAQAVPAPPAAARAVVDHRVVQPLTPGAPPLALVRSIWWAPGTDPAGAPDALLVAEHPQKLPTG